MSVFIKQFRDVWIMYKVCNLLLTNMADLMVLVWQEYSYHHCQLERVGETESLPVRWEEGADRSGEECSQPAVAEVCTPPRPSWSPSCSSSSRTRPTRPQQSEIMSQLIIDWLKDLRELILAIHTVLMLPKMFYTYSPMMPNVSKMYISSVTIL